MITISKLVKGRFKVVLEESWKHERPEVREPDRRWYEQIPTLDGGFIGLYSEHPPTLQYFTTTRRKICRELFAQHNNDPGWSLDAEMDGFEAVLYFPPQAILEVAEAVGGRKRRQVSEATKERLREMGKKNLWKKGESPKKGGQNTRREDPDVPESTISTQARQVVTGEKVRS